MKAISLKALFGFTLVEVLAVIGIVAVLSGVGVVSYNAISADAREKKLESDVATVNSAITLYRMNGGADFDASATPASILTELKRSAAAGSAVSAPVAGGSFIDLRTTAVSQTAAEGGTSVARARWNAGTQQFDVVTSGAAGVKEFVLGDVETPAAGTRDVGISLASSGWVWDYSEREAVGKTAGGSAPVAVAVAPAAMLSPPIFNPATGSAIPLTEFQPTVTVTITNPNAAGSIYYSRSNILYVGGIPVTLGDTVFAWVASPDRSRWLDSQAEYWAYTITPVTPTVAWSAPSSVTYDQVGGELPGDILAPTNTNAVLTISLPGVHPDFISGQNFTVRYTTDGTDPLTSETASEFTEFSAENSQISLPIYYWDFSGGQMNLRAVAVSASEYFSNSEEVTAQITAEPIALSAPSISPDQEAITTATQEVTISNSLTNPDGAQIRYTTDGAIPSAESPLYSGPFTVNQPSYGNFRYVQAIAVAPEGLESWFTDSDCTGISYTGMNFDFYNITGILIGGGNIANNAALNGSVVLATTPGNLPNVTFNNNAIVYGDVYAPGTPTVVGISADRIVDLNGPEEPSNYTITVENNAVIGTVYRRITPVTMPTVTLPTTLVARGTASSGTLLPGRYTTVNPGNNAIITLGVEGSTEPVEYRFDTFTAANNVQIRVVGPVKVTVNRANATQTTTIRNNTIFGNVDHPEWLELNIYKGNLTIDNNGFFYGVIAAPNSTVTFSNNAVFVGGVSAKYLNVNNNGSGVEFSEPPPTDLPEPE